MRRRRRKRKTTTTWSHCRWPRLQWGCDICQNLSTLTRLTKLDSTQQRDSSNACSNPVNVLTYETQTSIPMQIFMNV
jgi:hypothetical protein